MITLTTKLGSVYGNHVEHLMTEKQFTKFTVFLMPEPNALKSRNESPNIQEEKS